MDELDAQGGSDSEEETNRSRKRIGGNLGQKLYWQRSQGNRGGARGGKEGLTVCYLGVVKIIALADLTNHTMPLWFTLGMLWFEIPLGI